MNPHALLNFLSAVLTCATGLFATLKNRKSKINFLFFIFTISASIWQIGTGLAVLAKSPSFALIGTKIAFFGIALIPVLSYHLSLYISGVNKNRILIYGYICAVLGFIPLSSGTSLIFNGVYKYPWGFFFKAGPFHPIFLSFFIYFMILLFFNLFLSYKRETNSLEKNRKKYFLIAFFMAYIGSVDYLPTYGIQIYPFGYLMPICFISIFAYAILRYRLMEIEVIIKKTLVFASLFVVAFGIFVGITLLTQYLLIGGGILGLAISSIIIIFAVRPLEDFLINITDKHLFQKKYDYKQILKSFIDEVITVLNLDKIIQSTIDLLDKTLHPQNSAILLLNSYEDRYISYKTSGYNKEIALENRSKIVTLLKSTKDIFSMEKYEKLVRPNDKLKFEMETLNTCLSIPLMLHNDLIGIMLLGKKKSDEGYTKEDLDILTDLARTEAVAIGNAQLFAEAAQNERRAAIGTLAAGINHEVGNPLNIINTKMQVYMMSLERGLYKDKKPEDIIRESKEIMDACLQQTARISDITRKLSNFAKPGKEFKPELTDIEEQIDETLSVIGHELELERIDIKKNIQKPLPKILADKRQIEQIFFNIVKNAAQAIQKKGVIEIRAYLAQEGTVRNVKIEISDTGQGIPEDKLEKIYDPFFTTKEPGKGTGLGLSIVRQLVWRNRGDITVRSKVGEGTTFTLTFPEG